MIPLYSFAQFEVTAHVKEKYETQDAIPVVTMANLTDFTRQMASKCLRPRGMFVVFCKAGAECTKIDGGFSAHASSAKIRGESAQHGKWHTLPSHVIS